MTVRSSHKDVIPHAVFYDSKCFFCQRCINFLIKIDKKEMFVFGALEGKAAKEILSPKIPNYQDLNTIILVVNFLQMKDRYFIRAKAVLKILWIVGGIWKVLGFFQFLPTAFLDWIYMGVANVRRKLYKTPLDPKTEERKHRFLP
ncbi:MAG: hypothetical protein S4CHLAM37_09510 [Chlamydiia bacterium]|nr:hypothetical protein [Chlamydiia bacterium]